jgi:A/G-specific adenine glycosylase
MVARPLLSKAELRSFRTQLLQWFATYKRDLPWRRNPDPYRVWISEIMLQQTRVAAVVPYFEKFCAAFPNIRALADASQSEVLRMWSGLGYYSRARNMQAAAKQVVGEHAGIFPDTEAQVRGLSGIGQYTTNAILSIAFGKPHAVVEGNVARVIARLAAVRGDLRENGRWTSLQKTADELLSQESPSDWNQAMMELGATICTPQAPKCLICPVEKFCKARRLGIQEAIPEKRRKRATVEVVLASAVLCDLRDRCILLPPPTMSPRNGTAEDIPTLISRMWHFPTIAAAKNPESELRKYLIDSLVPGQRLPREFSLMKKVRHAVTYRSLTVWPYLIELAKLPDIAGARKLSLHRISSVPISNLTRKVAQAALAADANS